MVKAFGLFEVLFFGLVSPPVLLTLHPFIESRIVEVLGLLSVIISFDFIVNVVVFVESFLLRDVQSRFFLRLEDKIASGLEPGLKANYNEYYAYHDHQVLLFRLHLCWRCGIYSAWRLHLCNSFYSYFIIISLPQNILNLSDNARQSAMHENARSKLIEAIIVCYLILIYAIWSEVNI